MRVKIVNFQKFIRTLVIILGLGIILIFMGLTNSYSKGEIKYKETYIVKGDTLWSIAKTEAKENDYYKNKDIRDIIQEIKKANNLKDLNLNIGQKILIPTI